GRDCVIVVWHDMREAKRREEELRQTKEAAEAHHCPLCLPPSLLCVSPPHPPLLPDCHIVAAGRDCVIVVWHDMREAKRREEELRQTKEAAEAHHCPLCLPPSLLCVSPPPPLLPDCHIVAAGRDCVIVVWHDMREAKRREEELRQTKEAAEAHHCPLCLPPSLLCVSPPTPPSCLTVYLPFPWLCVSFASLSPSSSAHCGSGAGLCDRGVARYAGGEEEGGGAEANQGGCRGASLPSVSPPLSVHIVAAGRDCVIVVWHDMREAKRREEELRQTKEAAEAHHCPLCLPPSLLCVSPPTPPSCLTVYLPFPWLCVSFASLSPSSSAHCGSGAGLCDRGVARYAGGEAEGGGAEANQGGCRGASLPSVSPPLSVHIVAAGRDCVIVVWHDMREAKRREEELRQTKEAAEAHHCPLCLPPLSVHIVAAGRDCVIVVWHDMREAKRREEELRQTKEAAEAHHCPLCLPPSLLCVSPPPPLLPDCHIVAAGRDCVIVVWHDMREAKRREEELRQTKEAAEAHHCPLCLPPSLLCVSPPTPPLLPDCHIVAAGRDCVIVVWHDMREAKRREEELRQTKEAAEAHHCPLCLPPSLLCVSPPPPLLPDCHIVAAGRDCVIVVWHDMREAKRREEELRQTKEAAEAHHCPLCLPPSLLCVSPPPPLLPDCHIVAAGRDCVIVVWHDMREAKRREEELRQTKEAAEAHHCPLCLPPSLLCVSPPTPPSCLTVYLPFPWLCVSFASLSPSSSAHCGSGAGLCDRGVARYAGGEAEGGGAEANQGGCRGASLPSVSPPLSVHIVAAGRDCVIVVWHDMREAKRREEELRQTKEAAEAHHCPLCLPPSLLCVSPPTPPSCLTVYLPFPWLCVSFASLSPSSSAHCGSGAGLCDRGVARYAGGEAEGGGAEANQGGCRGASLPSVSPPLSVHIVAAGRDCVIVVWHDMREAKRREEELRQTKEAAEAHHCPLCLPPSLLCVSPPTPPSCLTVYLPFPWLCVSFASLSPSSSAHCGSGAGLCDRGVARYAGGEAEGGGAEANQGGCRGASLPSVSPPLSVHIVAAGRDCVIVVWHDMREAKRREEELRQTKEAAEAHHCPLCLPPSLLCVSPPPPLLPDCHIVAAGRDCVIVVWHDMREAKRREEELRQTKEAAEAHHCPLCLPPSLLCVSPPTPPSCLTVYLPFPWLCVSFASLSPSSSAHCGSGAGLCDRGVARYAGGEEEGGGAEANQGGCRGASLPSVSPPLSVHIVAAGRDCVIVVWHDMREAKRREEELRQTKEAAEAHHCPLCLPPSLLCVSPPPPLLPDCHIVAAGRDCVIVVWHDMREAKRREEELRQTKEAAEAHHCPLCLPPSLLCVSPPTPPSCLTVYLPFPWLCVSFASLSPSSSAHCGSGAGLCDRGVARYAGGEAEGGGAEANQGGCRGASLPSVSPPLSVHIVAAGRDCVIVVWHDMREAKRREEELRQTKEAAEAHHCPLCLPPSLLCVSPPTPPLLPDCHIVAAGRDCVIVVWHDMREAKRREEELRQTKEAAEAHHCPLCLPPSLLSGRDCVIVVWHDMREAKRREEELRQTKEAAEAHHCPLCLPPSLLCVSPPTPPSCLTVYLPFPWLCVSFASLSPSSSAHCGSGAGLCDRGVARYAGGEEEGGGAEANQGGCRGASLPSVSPPLSVHIVAAGRDCVIVVWHDMREAKRREEELRQTKEAAEAHHCPLCLPPSLLCVSPPTPPSCLTVYLPFPWLCVSFASLSPSSSAHCGSGAGLCDRGVARYAGGEEEGGGAEANQGGCRGASLPSVSPPLSVHIVAAGRDCVIVVWHDMREAKRREEELRQTKEAAEAHHCPLCLPPSLLSGRDCVIVVWHDMREAKRREEELRQTKEAAEAHHCPLCLPPSLLCVSPPTPPSCLTVYLPFPWLCVSFASLSPSSSAHCGSGAGLCDRGVARYAGGEEEGGGAEANQGGCRGASLPSVSPPLSVHIVAAGRDCVIVVWHDMREAKRREEELRQTKEAAEAHHCPLCLPPSLLCVSPPTPPLLPDCHIVAAGRDCVIVVWHDMREAKRREEELRQTKEAAEAHHCPLCLPPSLLCVSPPTPPSCLTVYLPFPWLCVSFASLSPSSSAHCGSGAGLCDRGVARYAGGEAEGGGAEANQGGCRGASLPSVSPPLSVHIVAAGRDCVIVVWHDMREAKRREEELRQTKEAAEAHHCPLCLPPSLLCVSPPTPPSCLTVYLPFPWLCVSFASLSPSSSAHCGSGAGLCDRGVARYAGGEAEGGGAEANQGGCRGASLPSVSPPLSVHIVAAGRDCVIVVWHDMREAKRREEELRQTKEAAEAHHCPLCLPPSLLCVSPPTPPSCLTVYLPFPWLCVSFASLSPSSSAHCGSGAGLCDRGVARYAGGEAEGGGAEANQGGCRGASLPSVSPPLSVHIVAAGRDCVIVVWHDMREAKRREEELRQTKEAAEAHHCPLCLPPSLLCVSPPTPPSCLTVYLPFPWLCVSFASLSPSSSAHCGSGAGLCDRGVARYAGGEEEGGGAEANQGGCRGASLPSVSPPLSVHIVAAGRDCVIVVWHDMREAKRREEELRQTKEAAEAHHCPLCLPPSLLSGRDCVIVVWHDMREAKRREEELRQTKEAAEAHHCPLCLPPSLLCVSPPTPPSCLTVYLPFPWLCVSFASLSPSSSAHCGSGAGLCDRGVARYAGGEAEGGGAEANQGGCRGASLPSVSPPLSVHIVAAGRDCVIVVWHDMREAKRREEELRQTKEAAEAHHCPLCLPPSLLSGRDCVIVVWHDMREAKRREEELRQAKEAAEAASRAKTQFLANMSHELRTPMNGVLGVVELLLGSGVSSEQRALLQVVRASGESLVRILSDLLDITRIESHSLALSLAPFCLHSAIDSTLSLMRVVAMKKGLQLSVSIDPWAPQEVVGDAMRFRQVLLNLLSNAIKFTDRGSVAVHVTRLHKPAPSHVTGEASGGRLWVGPPWSAECVHRGGDNRPVHHRRGECSVEDTRQDRGAGGNGGAGGGEEIEVGAAAGGAGGGSGGGGVEIFQGKKRQREGEGPGEEESSGGVNKKGWSDSAQTARVEQERSGWVELERTEREEGGLKGGMRVEPSGWLEHLTHVEMSQEGQDGQQGQQGRQQGQQKQQEGQERQQAGQQGEQEGQEGQQQGQQQGQQGEQEGQEGQQQGQQQGQQGEQWVEWVQVRVEDTGIGMPPHVIPHIFHPFTQADSSSSRRFGGTGLGLAICHSLIGLMGGEVSVESRPGVGSAFTVCIPFGKARADEAVVGGMDKPSQNAPTREAIQEPQTTFPAATSLAPCPLPNPAPSASHVPSSPCAAALQTAPELPAPKLPEPKPPAPALPVSEATTPAPHAPEPPTSEAPAPGSESNASFPVQAVSVHPPPVQPSRASEPPNAEAESNALLPLPPRSRIVAAEESVRSHAGVIRRGGETHEVDREVKRACVRQQRGKQGSGPYATEEQSPDEEAQEQREQGGQEGRTEPQVKGHGTDGEAEEKKSPFEGMRCLVAEDNRVNQLVVTRMLHSLGVACDVAVNGQEAVDKCAQRDYDLVLMLVVTRMLHSLGVACDVAVNGWEAVAKCAQRDYDLVLMSDYGPILGWAQAEEALSKAGVTLPEDMLAHVKEHGIAQLLLQRYIDLQVRGGILAAATRAFAGLRNRLLADPAFLFKVFTEIVIDSGCATFAEVRKRGDDFWKEFDLYMSDILVGFAVDAALVSMLAPMARFSSSAAASAARGRRGLVPPGLAAALEALPSSMFEAALPGRRYSVAQRGATWLVKGGQYAVVGFSCGLIGQAMTMAIVQLKRNLRKPGEHEEEDIKIPGLLPTALLWGGFMAVSSNTRYQIINGLERVVESSPLARSMPLGARIFTVLIRFSNNIFGSSQFVEVARWSGVQ
ncbi:unnamed protein product, partial [Closterium sp. Naga37s-1]